MPEPAAILPALDRLTESFNGALIRPGDAPYDEARVVWNGLYDSTRPALIVKPSSPEDVVAAVNYARENHLEVAVRGGGHSAVGYGTVENGIVIDLSELNEVEVDPIGRTATAGGGTTWGQFDHATQEHGLAVTGGRFSTTGIAGLTLGSGSGWLERKCGLTADNLVEAEVVTAGGRIVTANETENADLFWGLRGGGGNFGIVTSFTYKLHEVGPIVYGGILLSTPDKAESIITFMSEYMDEAPDDLGAGIAFLNAPPEPFVPEEHRFQPAIGIILCWTGDHAEGERQAAPVREIAKPYVDMVQPLPYEALQTMIDGGGPKGIRAYMSAEFMPELTPTAIAKLIRHGQSRPGPFVQLLLEPMGGAISRVPSDATALGRRDVKWCYHALSLWMEPDEESAQRHIAWAKGIAPDMASETTAGVYLNYTSELGEQKVRSTYGAEKYDRLQALKDKYDPGNLFRLNQNVPPSSGGAAGI